MKHKYVTIFLPTGSDVQYCTKDLDQAPTVRVAETITCDPGEVKVVVKEDGKVEGYAYVGMPYILNMF